MKIIRWLAVAVTALMALMNLGVVLGGTDEQVSTGLVVIGAALFVVGAAAAVGIAVHRSWGRPAVIGVGALNAVAGVVALVAGWGGGPVGIVVGLLGIVLGYLTDRAPQRRTAPSLG